MRRSIWQDIPQAERRVVNTDARASTAQVRELERLAKVIDWQRAWPIYREVIGERIDNYPVPQRYRRLTRAQASELIDAYKAA